MRKALTAVLFLLPVSCASGYIQGQRDFNEGMIRLHHQSPYARGSLTDAERELLHALAHENLTAEEFIHGASLRGRALIELGRHDDARIQLSLQIEGFDPNADYPGDPVSRLLQRAYALDPERAYGQLLLAERMADSRPARLHVA